MNKPTFRFSFLLFLLCCITHTSAAEKKPGESGVVDLNAQAYRVYYDSHKEGAKHSFLNMKKFQGQLRLPKLDEIFGSVYKLPEDINGNRVSAWQKHEQGIWKVTLSPSMKTVLLESVLWDHTESSALDLDGDGIVDIVDIISPTESRFTFVTEVLGRDIFEQWLQGENPLCKQHTIAGISLPMFGCDQSDNGSPGSGGANGTGGNSSFYDPWEELCGNENQSMRPPNARHRVSHIYGRKFTETITHQDSQMVARRVVQNRVFNEHTGWHIATETTNTYYDKEGNVIVVVQETVVTVDPSTGDAIGQRTVSVPRSDGSRVVVLRKTFQAQVNPDGSYTAVGGDNHPHQPDEDGNVPGIPPSSTGGAGGHPDPTNPDAGMAEWCENNEPYRSAAEIAATMDPTAFAVDCNDLVMSNGSGDCTIMEWARPVDFTTAVEVPNHNCGPLQEPGADGTCGTATSIQTLLGNTAWIGSVDLGTVEICDPTVCNPGNL